MNRNTIASLLVLALTGFVAGCNGGDLVGNPADLLGGSHPNVPTTVDPTNPHNGDQDSLPPGLDPTTSDQDGDGIPDGSDNIPCMAFYVKIWNQGVSSGSVNLNSDEIVHTSDFPTSAVIVRFVNPTQGTNVMTLGSKLAGSPEDELHIELWDTAATPTLYLHQTIVRGGGAPEEPAPLSFVINVQC